MASRLSCLSSGSGSGLFLLFLLLIALASDVQLSDAGKQRSVHPQECPKACDQRCSATQYRRRCSKVCMKCCLKCLCVPSGTIGHKDECPCYRDLKTKQGKPKCP